MPTAFSRLHIAPYIGNFLARYPEIELDVHIGDAFVDIIREGFDLAIRIGELEDSSLVARRIASDTRVICAAPAYLEKHGTPIDLDRPRGPQLPRRRPGRGVAARRAGGRDAICTARKRALQFRRVHPRAGDGGRRHRSAVDLGHRAGAAQRRVARRAVGVSRRLGGGGARGLPQPRVHAGQGRRADRVPGRALRRRALLGQGLGPQQSRARSARASRQISRRVGKASSVSATR